MSAETMGSRSDCAGELRPARRFRPAEHAALDLGIDDHRVVWASSAKASSEWSSSYAATTACGPPSIYPRGGDESGTWLASNSDDDPWIELAFTPLERAAAILVCETCGPGAVREIRDAARDVVLFEAPPRKYPDSRNARLLHVPLPAAEPAPTRLLLRVAPYAFGSEYHEIDAVALLTTSLDALLADPPTLGPTRHRRYAPKEVKALELRGDPRVIWANRAWASSEYSSSYRARDAIGPPTVFPRGGDHEGTWLAGSGDDDAWIELAFPKCERAYGLIVLETCGAGAVYRATDAQGGVLWQSKPEVVEEGVARLLHVELDPGAPPSKLRLWVSNAVKDYSQIDAVALLAAPFDELGRPPPPPPPPPTPGAPVAGFTQLEGVLLGASEEEPFVHATLRTPAGGWARNLGGPLRLRLESGEEVALEIGRTTLYGAPLVRERGPWRRVAAEAPRIASAFTDVAPADHVEVTLEWRCLDDQAHVELAGEPRSFRDAQGFRESARRIPESMVAAAISRGPLRKTTFAARGGRDFDGGARPVPTAPRRRPHPLRAWALGATIATGASLTTVALTLALAVEEKARVSAAVALLVSLFAGAWALELIGRVHYIPDFLRSPGLRRPDGRVAFTSPRSTLAGSVAALFTAGVTLVPMVVASNDPPAGASLRAAFALGGLYALARLVVWYVRQAPAFYAALRVARAPRGRAELGGRGRFTGTLAEGQTFRRAETFAAKSEHLGTETTTDAEGNEVTGDRWRHWSERCVSVHGPSSVRLILTDGTVLSTKGTLRMTDVALRSEPPDGPGAYARFEGAHEAGGEATVVGAMELDGAERVLDATHLVLGDLAILRRLVLVQALAFMGLVSLAAAGALVYLV